jgi:biopolymer transport protein TolQ
MKKAVKKRRIPAAFVSPKFPRKRPRPALSGEWRRCFLRSPDHWGDAEDGAPSGRSHQGQVHMDSLTLAAPAAQLSIWALFWQAGWVVKLVMIGLLCASIWTWAIIVDKLIAYSRMRIALNRFEQIFWSGQSLEELYRTLSDRKTSGMGSIFVAAMREWKKSFEKGARSPLGLQMRIDKAMDLALTREMERLEGRLGFLATIGSAGPFIGLFGTVVGIMTSFQAIAGSKSTSLAVVAPGIAEALLATAIGLLAAIPAVIAYNKLSSDVNKLGVRMEGFSDEFSAILSRQIDEKVMQQQRAA